MNCVVSDPIKTRLALMEFSVHSIQNISWLGIMSLVVKYFSLFVLLSVLYHSYITVPALTGVGSKSISREVLPDSMLYRTLYSVEHHDLKYIYSNKYKQQITTKNIAAFAYLQKKYLGYEYIDFYINLLLYLVAFVFFVKILLFYEIKSKWPCFLFVINPDAIYYVQAVCKEIPLLTLSLFFVFQILKNKTAIMSILLSIVFRYQIGLAFILTQIISRFRSRLILVLFVFLFVSAALPLAYNLPSIRGPVEAGEGFEKLSPGTGLGSIVRSWQTEYYFSGTFVLPFKVIQNLLEPFPRFNIYEYGKLSIYCVRAQLTQMLFIYFILFYIFTTFLKFSFKQYRIENSEFINSDVMKVGREKIEVFIYISLLVVSVNPFIHGRYLFNVFPFFIIYYYLTAKPLPIKKFFNLSFVLFVCGYLIFNFL